MKYFLFQIKHYLAFKYAKQQKEHLSTLNLFCHLQIHATIILNLFILKGLKKNSDAILLNTKKLKLGNRNDCCHVIIASFPTSAPFISEFLFWLQNMKTILMQTFK